MPNRLFTSVFDHLPADNLLTTPVSGVSGDSCHQCCIRDGKHASRNVDMEQDSMKRTILFTTALATTVGFVALGAAQASGKSDNNEYGNAFRNAYEFVSTKMSDESNTYRERNEYTQRKEYRERDEYQERENDRDSESHGEDGSDGDSGEGSDD
jgi:hypothetical protein